MLAERRLSLENLFRDKQVPEGLEYFYTHLVNIVLSLNKTGNYKAILQKESFGDEPGPYLYISTPQRLYGDDEDGVFHGALWVGMSDYSGCHPDIKVTVDLKPQEVIEIEGDNVLQYIQKDLEMKMTRDELLAYLEKVVKGIRGVRPQVGDTTIIYGRPYTYQWENLNSRPLITPKSEYDQQI